MKRCIVGLFAVLLIIAACLFWIPSHAWMGPGVGVMTSSSSSSSSSGSCTGNYGNELTTDAGATGEGSAQLGLTLIDTCAGGTTASISVRTSSMTDQAGYRAYLCLYANNSGTPGAQLGCCAYTGSNLVAYGTATQSCAVSTPAATAFVGISAEAAVNFAYSATTGGTSYWRYNVTNYAAPNDPASSSGTLDGDYNAYAFEAYVTY